MKKKKSNNYLFLFLFSLPFASIGIFMAYLTVATLQEWQDAKNWIPTDATIERIKLNRNRSSEGGSTYKVTGKYSYFFDDNHYKSTQITFSQGGDNIGSFQRNLHSRLKGSNTTTCFVNPEDPTQAILDNTLRLEMIGFYFIFVLAFGGAGFGLGIYSLRQIFIKKKTTRISDEGFRLSHSSLVLLISLGSLATILSSISYLIFPEILKQIQNGRTAAYTGVIFPALALILILVSIYLAIRHLSFGKSTLVIEKGFGIVGGKVEAYILTNCAPEKGFDITITCSRWVKSGDSQTKTKLYVDSLNSKDYDMTPNAKVKTNFSFTLPFSMPDSGTDGVTWTIDVKADIPGPDFSSSFQVPILKTDESDSSITTSKIFEEKDTALKYESIAQEKIKVHEANGTLHIYFPMFRKKAAIFTVSVFLTLWMGITVFLFFEKAWLFLFAWGFFDILIGVALFVMIFQTKKLTINKDGISFKKGFMGSGKERHYSIDEIQDIVIPSMNLPNKNYLKIKTTKKDIIIDKSITHKNATLALKSAIEKIIYETK
ncbi:MAG: DUF3592 domain-containing protein [Lentisphaeraceae bacterium]|nr:DUF3592 domain-containing protein [Lentisphaeraceae bacterium]